MGKRGVDGKHKTEVKTVSLYPIDWSVLQGIADEYSISISAAIRLTIQAWIRNRAMIKEVENVTAN